MKLTNLTGWASGLNWQMLLLKLAVVGGLLFGMYEWGHHNAELDCANAKTAQAEQKTKEVIKYVQVKVPEIQYKDRVSMQYRDRIVTVGGKLNDAIQAKPDVAGCELSPDEFQYFNSLIDGTKSQR